MPGAGLGRLAAPWLAPTKSTIGSAITTTAGASTNASRGPQPPGRLVHQETGARPAAAGISAVSPAGDALAASREAGRRRPGAHIRGYMAMTEC